MEILAKVEHNSSRRKNGLYASKPIPALWLVALPEKADSVMSALSSHLDGLILWLETARGQVPSHEVRMLEVNTREVNLKDGKYHVRKDQLRLPSQYESRFDELLQMGYPWLNLSCFGVYDGFLIVAVEVPTLPDVTPFRSSLQQLTSVNISGPQSIVCDAAWALDSVLTIE